MGWWFGLIFIFISAHPQFLPQERLKEKDILVKLHSVLDDIETCETRAVMGVEADVLPSVHIPNSPSISLQVTIMSVSYNL